MRGIQETWDAGRVIRLNMSNAINAAYAKELEVETLPAFLLFDQSDALIGRWVEVAPELSMLRIGE